MNNNLQRLLNVFVPCIILGILTALIIGMFVMVSYLLLWGLMFGIIFWIIASIREFFFPNSNKKIRVRGRIIEYRDED